MQGSRKHPAALEACVLEVPDEKRSEAIKAVVALIQDAALTEELRLFL